MGFCQKLWPIANCSPAGVRKLGDVIEKDSSPDLVLPNTHELGHKRTTSDPSPPFFPARTRTFTPCNLILHLGTHLSRLLLGFGSLCIGNG